MDDLVATLINPDAMEFGERWSDMFFNVEAVCYLTGKVDSIVGGQLLAAVALGPGVAGLRGELLAWFTRPRVWPWLRRSWRRTSSLSVVFDVDVPKLQLGAHAADAALNFAAAVAKHSGGEGVSSSVSGVAASGLIAKQQKSNSPEVY